MLDVRRLRVLGEVVETGSVTAAAQRLNYAPSAVSQHVAALERETGTTLLERVGRGVRPTAAALLLAEHAKDILARVQEAEAALLALRDGQTGRVVLAAFPTAGAGLVPTAIREFRRRCPAVAVSVSIVEEDEARASLRKGEVDVALVVLEAMSPAPDDETLLRVPLLDDPFRVLLNRRHRLASRRSIALSELADEPWITASPSSSLCERQVRDACQAAGFTLSPAVEADDYAAAQGYVAAGLGVALAPALALGAVHDGVAVRRIRGDEPVRHIVALARPAVARDGAVPNLLAALRAAADEQMRIARRGLAVPAAAARAS